MGATSRHVAGIPRWLFISALLILLIPVTTFLLNQPTVHHHILRLLKSHVGIEISAVHVQLIPKLSLEVFDVLVRDDRNAEPTLRAPHASLSVRFWPLLTKQLPMLELSAVEPELVIRRDREGVWHIPLTDAKSADHTSTTSDHQWVITNFHVNDGSLLILDEERPAAGGVRIHHVEAAFESNHAQTQAAVKLAGLTEDEGDLRIDGTLPLEKNGGPTTRSMGTVPARFEGTFQFQHFDLAYWFERTGQSVPAPHGQTAWRGNISSVIHLEFLPGAQGYNVAISDMSTDLDWLVIRGNMIVQSAGTDHPAYAVRLSTSPVTSDTFFRYVPSSWIPKKVRASLDEHELKGTVQLVSVALRGQINVLREPEEWHIIAKLSNGSGVWGEKQTRINKMSATVALDAQRADITELAGEVDGVQITSPKLTFSDLALQPTVEAHLLGIGKVERVLAVVQQFGGSGSPVLRSIADPSGTLQMAVHLAGPIAPKPSVRVTKAEVRIHDLGVRLAKNFSVAQLNGSIVADSRFLGVQHIGGVVQGIRFEAGGAVDIESGARVTNFTMHMSSDGMAIKQLLATRFAMPADVHLEGPIHAIVSLSGTVRAADCRSMIDLTDTEVVIPSVLHKKRGVPGRLEFEAKIIDGNRVIVDDFKLVLRESQLQGAGQIAMGPTPTFHVHMKGGPLSLRALADVGVRTPMTDGTFETSIMVSGEGTNWKLWTPSGWVTVRSGVVTLPGLEDELREVSGRLQVSRRGALLDEFSFKIGKSDVKVTGMVEPWRDYPRATFMVESAQLDMGKFVSTSSRDQATTSGTFQEWIQSKQATITFLIKQLLYERLVLRTVSGEIKLDPQKARLNELRGETPKGVLFGRGEVRLSSQQRMDINADLQVDGIPAQSLLSATESEKEPLQGDLSVNGVVKATVDSGTPIQNTLSTTGHGITIKVTNGRLQQDPVLTKVLKILNIPAVLIGQVDLDHGGIPFHSLSARVVARNGLFSSQDIVLDSPILKVTGAGTADIKDNGLDLALAVSPVAAYSALLDKIPLFSPLFGGDHEGLSTALFQAKGFLRDPEVSYLPLESLGKGMTGYPRLAVDVLLNTMKLPKTTFAYATQ